MANEHIGARQEIAFTVETERGTAVDPSSGDWYPHTGQSFLPVAEFVTDDSGMGRIESPNTEDIAKEYSQGAVTMRLHDSFLTPLNRMIFGAAGSVVTDTTTYTVENSNLHNSYTITTYDPVTDDKQYAKCMLNTATIAGTTDDYVNLNLEFMGGKEASTAVTPGYTTTAEAFSPDEITVAYATNFAGLSSPTSLTVKNFNLNIEKNVDMDWAVGSTEPDEITNGRLGVTGDFTVTYNATTMRDLVLAGTQQAIIITLNNSAFKWEIKLPSVKLKDWGRESDLNSQITQTFGFTANYNDTTNGLIQAVVTAL